MSWFREVAATALYGSFPGSGLSFESSCKCHGLKGPVERCFGKTKPFFGLNGIFLLTLWISIVLHVIWI